MPAIMALFDMGRSARGSHFSLHRVGKLTCSGLVYASLVGLTACATSAEVQSLRAEIAKANAASVHSEAEISRIQRELAVLKARATPPETSSQPVVAPAAPVTRSSGYKWSKLSE